MTSLVIKDTYRHKSTEVWNILGGKQGGRQEKYLGGQIPPVLPPLNRPTIQVSIRWNWTQKMLLYYINKIFYQILSSTSEVTTALDNRHQLQPKCSKLLQSGKNTSLGNLWNLRNAIVRKRSMFKCNSITKTALDNRHQLQPKCSKSTVWRKNTSLGNLWNLKNALVRKRSMLKVILSLNNE